MTDQKQLVTAGFELPKDVAATVFRYLFSKENSLVELYPNPIIVKMADIAELHKLINQKVDHYEVFGASFDAVASYENKKSEQYGTWDRFTQDDWGTTDVLDQLVLNWRFMIKFPTMGKPASYVISVRLAAALKPQHIVQALFSKNPEDVDRIEIELVPMSCRVDLVDSMLGEELLNLVSQWNKGRPSPQYIFPIMKKVKKHSGKIATMFRYSVPLLSFAACTAYYWTKTRSLNFAEPASTALIVKSNLWFAGTAATLFFTSALGVLIAYYTRKHLARFGSFTVFSLTKGDKNRQDELMARSKNSFWKFMFSGGVAVLWNIVAAILCAILINSKQ